MRRVGVTLAITLAVAGCTVTGPAAPIVDRTRAELSVVATAGAQWVHKLAAATGIASSQSTRPVAVQPKQPANVAPTTVAYTPQPEPTPAYAPPPRAQPTRPVTVQPLATPLPPAAPRATTPVSQTPVQVQPAAPLATPGAQLADARSLPRDRSYRVRAGDTVHAIARRIGVPARTIITQNQLQPPYVLHVGQRLALPEGRAHVVSRGETLYAIARRQGTDIRTLADLNGLKAPYAIHVGQRLALPENAPGATPELADLAARKLGIAPLTASEPQRSAATVIPASVAVAAAPASRQPDRAAALPAPSTATPKPPPKPRDVVASVAGMPRLRPPRPGRNGANIGPIGNPPPRVGGAFAWPVRGKLLAAYGPQNSGRHNDGLNISAPRGTPVHAAENGVVAYAGNEIRGFGNLVLVKHAGGLITAYAHNETLLVRRGDVVKKGQAIARVGSSGGVAAPQLHFEIRDGARAVDPSTMLANS